MTDIKTRIKASAKKAYEATLISPEFEPPWETLGPLRKRMWVIVARVIYADAMRDAADVAESASGPSSVALNNSATKSSARIAELEAALRQVRDNNRNGVTGDQARKGWQTANAVLKQEQNDAE